MQELGYQVCCSQVGEQLGGGGKFDGRQLGGCELEFGGLDGDDDDLEGRGAGVFDFGCCCGYFDAGGEETRKAGQLLVGIYRGTGWRVLLLRLMTTGQLLGWTARVSGRECCFFYDLRPTTEFP